MDNMTQEPCDFVKLVLQRMDSNPDEFEQYGRWNALCESLERYAGAYVGNRPVTDRNVMWAYDEFEIDLMLAKYREIYRAREYKNMLKNLLVGADGEATRSKSNNNAATVTLRLMQTSDMNDILTSYYQADKLANNGKFPLMIKDNSGRSLHVAEQAWVQKLPAVNYGAEAGPREWVIRTGELVSTVGGN
jgi:hypothetical protein